MPLLIGDSLASDVAAITKQHAPWAWVCGYGATTKPKHLLLKAVRRAAAGLGAQHDAA